MSHIMPDGSEKPVAYASSSVATAEKNYSQLNKDALAIIFGIKTIPPIHIWKEVSTGIRLQTFDEYPGCRERHDGFGQDCSDGLLY